MKIYPLRGVTSITYDQLVNLLVKIELFKMWPVESEPQYWTQISMLLLYVTSFFLIYLAVYKYWNAPFVLQKQYFIMQQYYSMNCYIVVDA
jgi:ABC-type multidrug transport system permease subunit